MKILLAEDNATCRSLVENSICRWGHEPVLARDGMEAWKIFQSPKAPRLAILDWLMPEPDGAEVCRRVRAARTDDPPYLIMLTVKGGRNEAVHGLEAGADDYIAKPFDQEELRARIQAGIRILDLQQRLADRVRALQDALRGIKTLQGLLPMCAWCKKIRDDRNYWQQVETYISAHSEARCTHSVCPECLAEMQATLPGLGSTPAPEA